MTRSGPCAGSGTARCWPSSTRRATPTGWRQRCRAHRRNGRRGRRGRVPLGPGRRRPDVGRSRRDAETSWRTTPPPRRPRRRPGGSRSRCASTAPTSTRSPRRPRWRGPNWSGRCSRRRLAVAFLGFLPGFAYLEGLPPALAAVARRSSPRCRCRPGAWRSGGGFAGIYPQVSPGGWQLLGRTGFELFDPDVAPFAVLAPGDTVGLRADEDPGTARDRARPPLAVRRGVDRGGGGSGPVVDGPGPGPHRGGPARRPEAGGRRPVLPPGREPPGGQCRRRRCARSHRPGAGAALRRSRPCRGGGPSQLRVDGLAAPLDTVVPVAAGQELSVGAVLDDLRCYLAVSGGFDLPPVLGSRSSDVLTGLGRAPCGPETSSASARPDDPGAGSAPRSGGPAPDPTRPTGHPGPRPPHHRRSRAPRGGGVGGGAGQRPHGGPAARGRGRRTGRVTPRGPGVASRGMVTGAVQVPPDGDPLVLLCDHATVGGYPVVATVVRADLGVLGQLRPGQTVRFELVDQAEADRGRLGTAGARPGRGGVVPGAHRLRAVDPEDSARKASGRMRWRPPRRRQEVGVTPTTDRHVCSSGNVAPRRPGALPTGALPAGCPATGRPATGCRAARCAREPQDASPPRAHRERHPVGGGRHEQPVLHRCGRGRRCSTAGCSRPSPPCTIRGSCSMVTPPVCRMLPFVVVVAAVAASLATIRHNPPRAFALLGGPFLAVAVCDWIIKPAVGRTFTRGRELSFWHRRGGGGRGHRRARGHTGPGGRWPRRWAARWRRSRPWRWWRCGGTTPPTRWPGWPWGWCRPARRLRGAVASRPASAGARASTTHPDLRQSGPSPTRTAPWR